MDCLTIEEQNIIESYLMDRLSASQREAFEVHYLDCQECLEKLELSRRLYDGLREVAAEESTRATIQGAVLAWLSRNARPLRAGLAMGILALMILPWAVMVPRIDNMSNEQTRLAHQLADALAPRGTSTVLALSPERSAAGDAPSAQITLPGSPEWIQLSLQLPPGVVAGTFRVRILSQGNSALWQDDLTADARGQVTLNIHTSWLEAADYAVELEEVSATSSPPIQFAFRVRPSIDTQS